MKKLLSNLLTIIISISIVGLFLSQFMILDRSFKQSQFQFETNVSKAVNEIQNTLISNIDLLFKNAPLRIEDIDYASIEDRGDSAILYFHQIKSDKEHILKLPASQIKEILQPEIDSNFLKQNEQNLLPLKNINEEIEKVRIYEFISLMNIKQQIASEKLTKYFNQMIWEKELAKGNFVNRIRTSYIDSLIHKKLQQNGCFLDFEFTINDPYSTYYSSNKDQSKNINAHPHSITLFSVDGYADNINLSIYFPRKNRFLMNSISEMIIISALFTLMILLTFIYSIHSFNKQKKITELKSDFLSRMSHDFKTPIATMGLAVDSITSDQLINKPDQIKLFGGILKEEISRLHLLLEKILEASMLQKGDTDLKLKETNINKLLSKVVQNLELHATNRNGEIIFKQSKNETNLLIDQGLFTHIINNLVDNAIKYNKRDPEIEIHIKSDSEKVVIIIKDNGIGISAKEQNKVFNKLYRIECKELGVIEGTGLGLYFVKKSVELMNGTIQLKSTLGKGTKFILSFPLVKENGKD